jgi:hypothetical protein
MDQTASSGDRNTLKGKLLRRRAIIRERECPELYRNAMACGYHRMSWQPITYQAIHQEMMWRVLRGEDFKDEVFFSTREQRRYDTLALWQRDMLPVIDNEEKFMRCYVNWLKGSHRLYNPRWKDWSWKFEDGQVKIRWAQNKAYEPLGVATLERDY